MNGQGVPLGDHPGYDHGQGLGFVAISLLMDLSHAVYSPT